MEERRKDSRADVEVEVRYRTAQEFVAAYSRNISGGGLFVRTTQPEELNQKLLLRFTLPGVDQRFEVRGIVVWSNASPRSSFPAGMGIKFLEMTPEDTKCIAEFVQRAEVDLPGPKKKT
jgi:type IV pilus assembly protein PilZ